MNAERAIQYLLRMLLTYSASWQFAQSSLIASAVGGSANLWGTARSLVDTLVLLTYFFSLATTSRYGSTITEVAVDTYQIACHTLRLYVLHYDLAGTVVFVVCTISTGSVQFSSVDNGVVLNRHGSLTVVLYNLVLCILCTTSLN